MYGGIDGGTPPLSSPFPRPTPTAHVTESPPEREINYSIWKLLKRPHSAKAAGIKMHLFEFLVDIGEHRAGKQTEPTPTCSIYCVLNWAEA